MESNSGESRRAVPKRVWIQPPSSTKLAINEYFAALYEPSPQSYCLVLETRALNTVRALSAVADGAFKLGAKIVVANPSKEELESIVDQSDSVIGVRATSHKLIASLASPFSREDERVLPAGFTSFDGVWLDYNGLVFAPSRSARLRREDILLLFRAKLLLPGKQGTAVLAVTQSLRSASFSYAGEAADSLVLLVRDLACHAGLRVLHSSLAEYGSVVTQLFKLGADACGAALKATIRSLPTFASGKEIPGTRFVAQYEALESDQTLLPLGAALKASADAVVRAVRAAPKGGGGGKASLRMLASDSAPLLPVVKAIIEVNSEVDVGVTLLCQSRVQFLFASKLLSKESHAKTQAFEVRLRSFL